MEAIIKNHYLKKEVMNEILVYCKNRWVAIELQAPKRTIVRYWKENKKPIELKNEDYYKKLIASFSNLRTIYATINKYRVIDVEKLKDFSNIEKCTPIIDIDGSLEDFEIMKRIAEIIVSKAEKFGIYKSIYLKWSGRGIHIHINENSISQEILKNHCAIDVAFAIVDFLINECKYEIEREAEKAKNKEREIKVENKIDIQRVFTVPLSFHRFLNFVCVCFKPNEISNFDLEWAQPEKFKHNFNWKEYVESEADQIAKIALSTSKLYTKTIGEKIIKVEREKQKIKRVGTIGRFQVMALLQAARYYLIKEKSIEKAKSFGLNRAIFYAWAKYYKPIYGFSRKTLIEFEKRIKEGKMKFDKVGNELAPISERGWYYIGDKEQLPIDFDKNVTQKIEVFYDFNKVWEAVLKYLESFPKEWLEDQRMFFEKIYKPVRDNIEKIFRKKDEKKSLADFLK